MGRHRLVVWTRWLFAMMFNGLSASTRARILDHLSEFTLGMVCAGAILFGLHVIGTSATAAVTGIASLVGASFGVLFITAAITLLWLSYHHDDPRKNESAIRKKIEDMRDLQQDVQDPHTRLRLAESIGTLEWVLEEYDDDHYRETVTPDEDDENVNEPTTDTDN